MMWIDLIPTELQSMAIEKWEEGDWEGFLRCASHDHYLDLVVKNLNAFRERGCYEAALLHAYIGGRATHASHTTERLRILFRTADRGRLLASGDPLPGPGPFILYRGVAGKNPWRRERGFSWSRSLMQAAWFAWRYGPVVGYPDLYKVTVPASAVLFYSNARKEEEFLVDLPRKARLVRMALPTKEEVEKWGMEQRKAELNDLLQGP